MNLEQRRLLDRTSDRKLFKSVLDEEFLCDSFSRKDDALTRQDANLRRQK
jgi:hypothetical protein